MISILILLTTFNILFLLFRVYKDLFAPLSVMVGTWGLSLGLYYLKLIRYYDLELTAIMVIGLGLLAFFFGSVAVPRGLPRQSIPKEILRKQISPERLFFVCSLVFAAGFVGELLYLQAVNEALGIRYVLQNPADLHFEAAVGSLKNLGLVNLLASTNLVSLVLLISFLSIFHDHKWAKFVWLEVIVTLGAVLFRTSRTGVFIPVLWSVVTWAYINGGLRISRKRLVPILLIAGFLASIFIAVSSLIGKTESASVSLSSYWNRGVPFNASVASLYHYATSALPALQTVIDKPPDLLFGQASFLPLVRVAQLVDPAIVVLEVKQPFVYVPVATNVYTYLAPFYQDFGVVGVVLLPFILGVLATGLYLRWRRRPSLAFILTSALVTTTLFWTSFQSILGFTIIWYYAAIAFLAGKLAHRPRSREVSMGRAPLPKHR